MKYFMIIALFYLYSSFTCANDTNELLVLLNKDKPSIPSHGDVIDGVRSNSNNIVTSLGDPNLANYLLKKRAPPNVLSTMSENSDIYLLHEYIVLGYPSVHAANVAFNVLNKHPWVKYVTHNKELGLSIIPNDEFYNDGSQFDLDEMNYISAWDLVKGHSYIGAIDSGIESGNPIFRPDGHPDLMENFREHFSYDYAQDDTDVDELGGITDPTEVVYAGHGTMVSGLITVSTNNYLGIAGGCWYCSILMGKFRDETGNTSYTTSITTDAIEGLVERGAQVINLSAGLRPDNAPNCVATPNDAFCLALSVMYDADTLMVSAAGNDYGDPMDFPANQDKIIGVGAYDSTAQTVAAFSNTGETGGVPPTVVAPGVGIYSTTYANKDWNTNSPWYVGDSLDTNVGYSTGSGTSFSSPRVASLAGLIRSANPLLSSSIIKELIVDHSTRSNNCTAEACGAGIPDAYSSIKSVYGLSNGITVVNRLTPLFSFESTNNTNGNNANDSFHTTSPQMAKAALDGTMRPLPPPDSATPNTLNLMPYTCNNYDNTYKTISGYSQFPPYPPEPNNYCIPLAQAFIFVSDTNPITGQDDLVPLYRMSLQDPRDGNDYNIDHGYLNNEASVSNWKSVGYNLDGIEGYLYPPCTPEPSCMPANTVIIKQRYNPNLVDHQLYANIGNIEYFLNLNGYTDQIKTLGYAYPNTDTDNDGLIDGIEILIGTNINNVDSDNDNVQDGIEYPLTEICVSDPMSNSFCCGQPSSISLVNETISSNIAKTACNTINAENNYIVDEVGIVSFSAGTSITQGPGFSVMNGGTFTANIVQ